MEKKTEYILKRTLDNPFDKTFKECFSLFEKGKDEVIAIIYDLPKGLEESSLQDKIFTRDDFRLVVTGKKSKHLTIGDPIHFSKEHDYFKGILLEIIEDKNDYWNDIFVIGSCAFQNEFIPKFIPKSIKPPKEIERHLRQDCSPVDWNTVEFKCPCCGRFN